MWDVYVKVLHIVDNICELLGVKISLVLFSRRSRRRRSVWQWLCLTGLQRHPYPGSSRLAGCVHSSVNKTGANGRVSYDSVTHSDSIVEILRRSGSWIKPAFSKTPSFSTLWSVLKCPILRTDGVQRRYGDIDCSPVCDVILTDDKRLNWLCMASNILIGGHFLTDRKTTVRSIVAPASLPIFNN